MVTSSAFFSASFGTTAVAANVAAGGPFGYQTFAQQTLLFPPQSATYSPSWANSQAYSWHSYGKTGHALLLGNQGLQASLAALPTPITGIPLFTTEHQSHTNGDWNGYNSTVESPFEASRLANQLVSMAAGGYDSYVRHRASLFAAVPWCTIWLPSHAPCPNRCSSSQARPL